MSDERDNPQAQRSEARERFLALRAQATVLTDDEWTAERREEARIVREWAARRRRNVA